MEEAAEALLKVLDIFSNFKLRIIGDMKLPEDFRRFDPKIERRNFSSYDEYMSHLSECDINIAPLESSVLNDGRSNINFLEASALQLPTVCSPRAAFYAPIENGRNGFLCTDNKEWLEALSTLISSKETRTEIAAAAYETITNRYLLSDIAKRQLFPLVKKLIRPKKKLRVVSANVFYNPLSYGGATILAEEINKLLNAKDDLTRKLPNIQLVPAYNQETIDDYFDSIDVLLFPTQCKESFRLTVREALARNVWVISTDAGGCVDNIITGKNGLVIPFEADGEVLKQSIIDTMTHFERFGVGSEVILENTEITRFEDQASNTMALAIVR